MIRCIRALTLCGLILAASNAQAEVEPPAILERAFNTVLVHNFDVDDGLPQNTVHAIAQTRDGYLWAATWEGVARFNGRSFKVFDAASVSALNGGGVRSLLATSDGGLWLGQSENGLARVTKGQWSNAILDTDLSTDQVLALIEDSKHRVYAGTADHGVKQIDHGAVRQLAEPGRRVLGMTLDSNERLLLATHLGLQRIDVEGGQIENFDGGQMRAVLDLDGRILTGGDEGLQELIGHSLRRVALPASLKSASITSLLNDDQGRLWFGTQSEGLFRATFAADGRISLVEKLGIDEGLPNLRVLSLSFDHEGSLWVGTNGGLSQVIETGIARIGGAQGLDNAFARTVAEAPNGDTYIGTSGGLYQYRKGALKAQWDARTLGSSSVTTLLFDALGDLWVGTYDAGVSRMHDGRVIAQLNRGSGLHQLSIRTMLFDAERTLWLGTSEGLVRYADGKGEVVDLFPKPAPDFILSLALAPDHSVWIGTAVGLAHRAVDGEVHIFDKAAGYPALDTFDIHFEDAEHAWLATDAGLLAMHDGQFHAIGRAQGMPSDTVFRLLIDHSGAFWLTSNRGLALVERSAIDAVIQGAASTLVPTLLNAENGMSATQVNGGTGAAGMLATDGSLWIPTSNGVSHLQPARYPMPPRPAVPLSIEGIEVDGVEATLPLEVPAGARRIEFDIAGLAFSSVDNLRYRHWLEGFDADFGAATPEARIGYTNLPPGRYVLHTQARNGERGELGTVLDLPFTVLATWAQTRWIQALIVGLIVLFGFLIYTRRVASLRSNERRLAAMVNERTLELQERALALDAANDEKTRLLEQLGHQALHDSLTGLPNRHHADRHLAECFAAMRESGGALYIAIMDVDHFKRINDEHGHQAGDRVLAALAACMRAMAGVWCARIGGEEFLLITEPGGETGASVFEQLRAAIAHAPIIHFQDQPISATISIGWVNAADFSTVDKALAEADRRLYQAKSAGRNRIEPDPALA